MKTRKGRIQNPPKQKPKKHWGGSTHRPVSIRALKLALASGRPA